MYTKLFLVMSITFLTTTFTLLSFFTGSAFAQLEERNGINQTMQDIVNLLINLYRILLKHLPMRLVKHFQFKKMLLTLEPTSLKEQKI